MVKLTVLPESAARCEFKDGLPRCFVASRATIPHQKGSGTLQELPNCKPAGSTVEAKRSQIRSPRTIPFADRDRRSHGVLEKPVHAKAGIFEAHQEVPIPVTYLLLSDRANDAALITPDCVRAGKSRLWQSS